MYTQQFYAGAHINYRVLPQQETQQEMFNCSFSSSIPVKVSYLQGQDGSLRIR